MNAATQAAVITGVFAVIGISVSGWFAYKAQLKTAKASEAASILDGYAHLYDNQNDEIARLRRDIEAERADCDKERQQWHKQQELLSKRLLDGAQELASAENRCRECNDHLGDLMANMAALRAIVLDEVARAAVDNQAGPNDIKDMRAFLQRTEPEAES